MGDLLWIGVLAAALLVLRYRPDWVNQLVIGVAGKVVGRVALAAQPDTITLVPAPGSSGTPLARSAVEGLSQRGFMSAGSFTIPEMKDLPVHFLIKAQDSAIAVVYEHPQAGVFTDLVCRYQDGRRFTVTNARIGGGLEPRPDHITIRKPGISTGALCLMFQRERPTGPLLPVSVADVPRVFAEAYAEEMAWRKNRGVSKAEVRNVAREMRQDPRRRSDAPAA